MKATITEVGGEMVAKTEYGIYKAVIVSGQYGLFEMELNEGFECIRVSKGQGREAAYGDEAEIDGMTFVATIDGWQQVEEEEEEEHEDEDEDEDEEE
jgi:hypothetical protein